MIGRGKGTVLENDRRKKELEDNCSLTAGKLRKMYAKTCDKVLCIADRLDVADLSRRHHRDRKTKSRRWSIGKDTSK